MLVGPTSPANLLAHSRHAQLVVMAAPAPAAAAAPLATNANTRVNPMAAQAATQQNYGQLYHAVYQQHAVKKITPEKRAVRRW